MQLAHLLLEPHASTAALQPSLGAPWEAPWAGGASAALQPLLQQPLLLLLLLLPGPAPRVHHPDGQEHHDEALHPPVLRGDRQ
jgi:hypothetical protein